MTAPTLTLDSKYPGLIGVWDGTNSGFVHRMTREEARQFGIDVLVMSEQGFMRAEPAHDDHCGDCRGTLLDDTEDLT